MGNTVITSEINYSKADLVNYWQVFDSLTTPNIVAQGLLINEPLGLTP